MKNLISFIGFGEAAFHIANGLRSEGLMEIIAYDVNQDHDKLGEIIRNRAQESGVILADSLEEAYGDSKFIVSLTSAKVAYNVAKGDYTKFKVWTDIYRYELCCTYSKGRHRQYST